MSTFRIDNLHKRTGKPLALPRNIEASSLDAALGRAALDFWRDDCIIRATDPATGESVEFRTAAVNRRARCAS